MNKLIMFFIGRNDIYDYLFSTISLYSLDLVGYYALVDNHKLIADSMLN